MNTGTILEIGELTENVDEVFTLESQVSISFSNVQDPLLDARVKKSSLLAVRTPMSGDVPATLNLAQVPNLYQVPRLMIQPFRRPLVNTSKFPRPVNGLPVGEGPGCSLVVGFGE